MLEAAVEVEIAWEGTSYEEAWHDQVAAKLIGPFSFHVVVYRALICVFDARN